MCKVYVDLKTRKNIFPFSSEMGAIYFATSLREYAEHHNEYLPAIDIVSEETGEVLYQSPEICPCEWHKCDGFEKAISLGMSPCKSCLRKDCVMRDAILPW